MKSFPSSSINELEEFDWKKKCLVNRFKCSGYDRELFRATQEFFCYASYEKYELVKGDVIETLPKWFESNPCETVALCIFDMDLGIPTKKALEDLKTYTKGSILVFDEYSHPLFPDEGRVAEIVEANKFKFEKVSFFLIRHMWFYEYTFNWW